MHNRADSLRRKSLPTAFPAKRADKCGKRLPARFLFLRMSRTDKILSPASICCGFEQPIIKLTENDFVL